MRQVAVSCSYGQGRSRMNRPLYFARTRTALTRLDLGPFRPHNRRRRPEMRGKRWVNRPPLACQGEAGIHQVVSPEVAAHSGQRVGEGALTFGVPGALVGRQGRVREGVRQQGDEAEQAAPASRASSAQWCVRSTVTASRRRCDGGSPRT